MRGDTDQAQEHQTGQRQHRDSHAAWPSEVDERASTSVAIHPERAMTLRPHGCSLPPRNPLGTPVHHADFGIQQGSQMSDPLRRHNGIVEHTQRENAQPLTPTSAPSLNPLHLLPPLTLTNIQLMAMGFTYKKWRISQKCAAMESFKAC